MLIRIVYRFLLVAVVLFSPSTTLAQKPGIQDLLVTNNASHVLVYARVTNAFTNDIENAIMAGVPTTFTFLIDFFKERTGWFDEKLGRTAVRYTIKYDNVKKLFMVSSNVEKKITTFPDFESAKLAMADLNGVPIKPLQALKKGERYYVLVKVKLDQVRLPLHLEYIFFFVSLWDFETDWYRGGFSY